MGQAIDEERKQAHESIMPDEIKKKKKKKKSTSNPNEVPAKEVSKTEETEKQSTETNEVEEGDLASRLNRIVEEKIEEEEITENSKEAEEKLPSENEAVLPPSKEFSSLKDIVSDKSLA